MKVFISDTTEVTGFFNKIVVLQDTQFEELEMTDLIKYESSNVLAGSGAIVFYAGTEFEGRITKVKLYNGAIGLY